MATEIPATGRASISFASASTRSLSSVGSLCASAIAQHVSARMVTAARFMIGFCDVCAQNTLPRDTAYSLRCADEPGSKISGSCQGARWSWKKLDAIAETSQFADHLARPHLLRLFADGRPAFL